jgi:hypothetical protein
MVGITLTETNMATVKKIEVSKIKAAKHNPKGRDDDINGLARSIEAVGLLDPVKVTTELEMIDGHRRLAAFKKLKYTEIDAIVLSGNASEMYAHLNGQSKRLSGNQMLQVYLANEEAVPKVSRARFAEAEETLGESLFKRLVNDGASIATYNLAVRLANLNDRGSTEGVQKACRWLLHYGCHGVTTKALAAGTAPGLIWAAIQKNKTIRVKFDVGK